VHRYDFIAFTSPCELHIDIADKALADSVAHIIYLNAKRLESQYSFFTNSSELYPLNNRTSNQHTLSDELATLLQIALFYSEKTEGAFDIATAGTLKEASLASTLEEYQQLREKLLPFASSSELHLEGNTLTFLNAFTKIDLGGLVKEYAVDASLLMLKTAGVTSALVNFCGDIVACGNYNASSWNIGIQNPKNEAENLCEIALNDNALCTSGHSKRFYEIEQKRQSHIISKTSNHYAQISIVAPTATDAGIWSTALLVNPKLTPPSHIKIAHSILEETAEH